MKNVIYSALYNEFYPFESLAEVYEVVAKPEDLKDTNSFLIIWGGADIDPKFYNHPRHSSTYPGGKRDDQEWALVQQAIKLGIPIIGVCRGAQLLCAAAGGFLLQDVTDHIGTHMVTTKDEVLLNVNSIHHQMMCMEELSMNEYELVAWRGGRFGGPYEYRNNQLWIPEDIWKEPEFVYFTKIKGYAIQWHPEGMDRNCLATKYILNYISKKEMI